MQETINLEEEDIELKKINEEINLEVIQEEVENNEEEMIEVGDEGTYIKKKRSKKN